MYLTMIYFDIDSPNINLLGVLVKKNTPTIRAKVFEYYICRQVHNKEHKIENTQEDKMINEHLTRKR